MEIVDKEHVEDKVVDCPGRIYPGYDVIVRLLHPAHGAPLGQKSLDSVHILHKSCSVKLRLGNLKQNFIFIFESGNSRSNLVTLVMDF